jgi:hypothetical protein
MNAFASLVQLHSRNRAEQNLSEASRETVFSVLSSRSSLIVQTPSVAASCAVATKSPCALALYISGKVFCRDPGRSMVTTGRHGLSVSDRFARRFVEWRMWLG